MTDQEYMDQAKTLFDIYSAILFNFSAFVPGEPADLTYGLHCPEYKTLLEKYPVAQIAGEGGDFERARRLLHHLASRLRHDSMYDNHIPCDALHLLEFSYEQPDHGINCRNKSKILAECCLALGIYARRVWLMPFSPYDSDCHVITEIYDRQMKKWIMLDPTSGGYFVDEDGIPLSPPEIRERFAGRKTASFVPALEDEKDMKDCDRQYVHTYICKNSFYFTVERWNGFGDRCEALYVLPAGYDLVRSGEANFRYRQKWLDEMDLPAEKKQSILDAARKGVEHLKTMQKISLTAMTASPI